MSVNVIKAIDGEEYVLLPTRVYQALRQSIDKEMARQNAGEYVPFELEDYIDNPVAMARIKANITQEELARRMNVSQAYISKIERQDKVTAKLLDRVNKALSR
ncbi:MAG TPA: XRE family transcriptional regulator [Gammaproteobacteria bacterium]|nr:XRE family transcriptional regulator [Gammaproteobacteria bacterium]